MNICNCGSIEEATERAETLFIEIAGADCDVWAYQIAVALRHLCIESLVKEGIPRKDLLETSNMISGVAAACKTPIDQLRARVADRRRSLYGE